MSSLRCCLSGALVAALCGACAPLFAVASLRPEVTRTTQTATELVKRVVAFIDAGLSGSGSRSVLPEGTRPLVAVREALPEAGAKVFLFTAGTAREGALVSPDRAHGVFSQHLHVGLTGAADANRDAAVSLAELADYVRTRTANEARERNVDQHPTLSPAGADAASVILSGGAAR